MRPKATDTVNPSERRELNEDFGDGLSRAFELVLTPMVFGFFGYLLDGRLGTRPLFMFVFFAFVFGYECWKLYMLYASEMDEQQRKLRNPTPRSDRP